MVCNRCCEGIVEIMVIWQTTVMGQFISPTASDSEIPPLEIIAYYDDVEMCNPIGSRAKKHKLGKLHYQDFLGLVTGMVNFLNYQEICIFKE